MHEATLSPVRPVHVSLWASFGALLRWSMASIGARRRQRYR